MRPVARDRAANDGCPGGRDGADDMGPPGEILGGFSFCTVSGWRNGCNERRGYLPGKTALRAAGAANYLMHCPTRSAQKSGMPLFPTLAPPILSHPALHH